MTVTQKALLKGLDEYFLLGRSGLRVSPLCLGTMTFGTAWGWGADEKDSRAQFDRYLDAGGNFIDTADGYTGGESETFLGGFIRESGLRDKIVLATKFTFNAQPGNPNAGGNGRKNIRRALESSLKRLQTDYIDLYWLHAWDGITPVEEVMSTLTDLVREGKIRHVGLSDTPAWYLAKAQMLAAWRGFEPVCALQLEYSLMERNIEREHVPAAIEFGMGICPWSPLAGGMLTGKYTREAKADGRLAKMQGSGNPIFDKFTERNFTIVDALLEAAKELERSPAQVALNWATRRPGMVSTIIGASKLSQLEDNIAALSFDIPAEIAEKLEAVGRPELFFPYTFFRSAMKPALSGGVLVSREPGWYRG